MNKVSINRIIRLFNRYVLSLLDTLVLLVKRDKPLNYPPVFILGAPRSGTTLIYQLITSHFNLGYISNRQCRVFGMPTLVSNDRKNTRDKDEREEYHSIYGETSGSDEPSECGDYWYRFFRREPVEVGLKDISELKRKLLRRSISQLSEATSRTIVFKNVYNISRLEPIAETIPEAIFIVIRRNTLNNAESILHARKKIHGDYARWWSLPLPNKNLVNSADVISGVLEQVNYANSTIDEKLIKNKEISAQVIEIEYEELCSRPCETMESIRLFFEQNNIKYSITNKNIPDLRMRSESRIPTELYEKLKDSVDGRY